MESVPFGGSFSLGRHKQCLSISHDFFSLPEVPAVAVIDHPFQFVALTFSPLGIYKDPCSNFGPSKGPGGAYFGIPAQFASQGAIHAPSEVQCITHNTHSGEDDCGCSVSRNENCIQHSTWNIRT